MGTFTQVCVNCHCHAVGLRPISLHVQPSLLHVINTVTSGHFGHKTFLSFIQSYRNLRLTFVIVWFLVYLTTLFQLRRLYSLGIITGKYRRKWSWPVLRFYLRICLEKPRNTSGIITGRRAESGTRSLPNVKSWQLHGYIWCHFMIILQLGFVSEWRETGKDCIMRSFIICTFHRVLLG
jgi:hypothetical protein